MLCVSSQKKKFKPVERFSAACGMNVTPLEATPQCRTF
jgi:hypothetical protein